MTRAMADIASAEEKSKVYVADQASQIGAENRVEISPDEKRGRPVLWNVH